MAGDDFIHSALGLLRRVILAAGIVSCIVIAGLWIASKAGCTMGYFGPGRPTFVEDGDLCRPLSMQPDNRQSPSGWAFVPRGEPIAYDYYECYRLPLWVPLILLLIPTLLATKLIGARLRLNGHQDGVRGPLSPFWRRMKWLGVALFAVSLLIACPNPTQCLRYIWTQPSWNGGEGFWLGDGCIGYIDYVVERTPTGTYVVPSTGWSLGRTLDSCDTWMGGGEDVFGVRWWNFPSSLLLLATGLPTLVLWVRDRRHASGRCVKCGYDLTGNVSGRCPECAQVVKRANQTSVSKPPHFMPTNSASASQKPDEAAHGP